MIGKGLIRFLEFIQVVPTLQSPGKYFPIHQSGSTMMRLQSDHHSDQVLAVLQNQNGCDILLIGNDNVSSHSDSLWILSPLVRSIIGSLGNIRDNLIILPDFSYEDIKRSLEIIEGNKREDFMFNCSTKHLLETLGVGLMNSWTGGGSQNSGLKIKTEKLGSNDEDQENEEVEDTHKLILNENPNFDITSDDEEETEQANVAVNELSSGLNIRVEETVVTNQDDLENGDENQDDDEDDIQSQLLMDQDLSDSDDESFLQNDINMEQSEIVQQMLQDKFIQELLEEGDSTNETQGPVEEVSDTERNSQDQTLDFQIKSEQFDQLDFQQQKLAELEELMVKENGRWKCKECNRTNVKKPDLRRHAEIHVIGGLSFPCDQCSERFPTRSRLKDHRGKKHKKMFF